MNNDYIRYCVSEEGARQEDKLKAFCGGSLMIHLRFSPVCTIELSNLSGRLAFVLCEHVRDDRYISRLESLGGGCHARSIS